MTTTWRDIPGWTCPRIIEIYDEMARELKPGSVAVECGVAYGKSLAYLASVLDPGVDILAVDIFATFQGRTTLDPKVYRRMRRFGSPMSAAQENVYDALTPDGKCGESDRYLRIEWVPQRSEDVPAYLDFDVDFVFLDDHHEEESVYAEIMAWLPRLKSGGVIAGHDINSNYPGVERAVRRAFEGCAVVDMPRLPEVSQTGSTHTPVGIRPPAPGENGWGGVWVWRKP